MNKTNAMRLLDQAKIEYSVIQYNVKDNSSFGEQAVKEISLPASQIFKTLITKGDKTGIVIFCIPVNCELNLKKAASISGNKKVEMILSKDVLSLTGYMTGACTPIGMKKRYPIYIDESALQLAFIGISGGLRGYEIVLNPISLGEFINCIFVNIKTNPIKV